MSTITRERAELKSFITGFLSDPMHDDQSAKSMTAEVFRIALASLGAEPVTVNDDMAYAFHHALSDSSLGADEAEEIKAGLRAAFANVTAPTAPVSVPDLKPVGFLFVAEDGAVAYSPTDWPMEGFNLIGQIYGDLNACRDAMLQGAENAESTTTMQTAPAMDSSPKIADSPSGNSLVIPEGWVACSERMPEDEQEVIVQNKMGYRYVSYFDEHSGLFFDMRGGNQMNCIEHIFVTHWMPMPAAPQQEA